jgi:hypothetical protein
MTDARLYVASMAEESLGLVGGSLAGALGEELLPQSFVDNVASVLRGGEAPPGTDVSTPYLEKELFSLLPRIRDASLQRDGFFVRKARWPGASPLAVCLTHDVDNIARPFEHVWKTRERFGRLDTLGAFLGRSLYNNVSLVASAEDGRGLRSSFYFMSSEYPLEKVRAVSDRISESGWEVGLHGDFATHDSLEKMNEAVAKFSAGLGFRPIGVREHYLKFDFSKTWEIMEAAGFEYDTTVGNTDRLGFRVGMATPFHPPSADWRPLNLIELPLTLMDTTLWGYLKRTEDQGFEDSIAMMNAVEEVEGLFTLLWHQEAVRMKGGRIYWRLIDAVKKKGCYTGSGAEIAAWWRVRSVPMVKRGNLISMGAAPPEGLVLKIAIRDGRVPRVSSGSLEKLGEYEYLARVGGAGFSLEVS